MIWVQILSVLYVMSALETTFVLNSLDLILHLFLQYFEFKCRIGRTPAAGSIGFGVWRPDGAGNYDQLGEYTLDFECPDESKQRC